MKTKLLNSFLETKSHIRNFAVVTIDKYKDAARNKMHLEISKKCLGEAGYAFVELSTFLNDRLFPALIILNVDEDSAGRASDTCESARFLYCECEKDKLHATYFMRELYKTALRKYIYKNIGNCIMNTGGNGDSEYNIRFVITHDPSTQNLKVTYDVKWLNEVYTTYIKRIISRWQPKTEVFNDEVISLSNFLQELNNIVGLSTYVRRKRFHSDYKL